MSLQIETVKTASKFGVTLHHSWTRQGSDKLLIMLPGRGYTCDHPILHYLRNAAVQQGYDVLSVQYGLQITGAEMSGETIPFAHDDAQQAVEPLLKHGYKKVCVAGKSLGTPIAVDMGHRFTDATVSLLLLTPIGGAVMTTETLRTLALIGTADALYSADWVASFAKNPTITWRVYEGLNHSLEAKGDWQASLKVLPEIIAECETFLIS